MSFCLSVRDHFLKNASFTQDNQGEAKGNQGELRGVKGNQRESRGVKRNQGDSKGVKWS